MLLLLQTYLNISFSQVSTYSSLLAPRNLRKHVSYACNAESASSQLALLSMSVNLIR